MKATARLSLRMGAKAAAVLGASALLTCAIPASAQLAYEGFDTLGALAGTSPTNNGDAIEWSGTWGAPGAGTANVIAGNLGYTDSLGNQLVTGAGNGHLYQAAPSTGGTNNQPTILLSTTRGESTTTWISFVGQRLGPDGYWAASFQLRTSALETLAVGELSTGTVPAADAEMAKDLWGMFARANLSGATATDGSDNTADGYSIFNQSLILIRIDNVVGAGDTARMWVNPDLSIAPSDASASVTLTGFDMAFDRVRLFARRGTATAGQAGVELALDEIRIGGSFADVTPFLAIPEPSTYAAILGGLTLGLAVWRRSRRERRD